MPAFTIITVCLNIASTIRRTCESIINQTLQDFQWIVVDGASTDGTLDILKEYSSRIDILISEPDKGIYNAMNKGIRLANGEYINFMNGGDEFYDNNVLKNVFHKGLDFDIVYGDSCHIYKNENQIITTTPEITAYDLYYYYRLTHASCFVKTSVQQQYMFNEKMIIAADREFFSKVFQIGCSFKKTDIIISKFHRDGISCLNNDLKNKEDECIKHKYFKSMYYKEHSPKLYHLYEFLSNSIKYPRYFLGWVKRLIVKQKA